MAKNLTVGDTIDTKVSVVRMEQQKQARTGKPVLKVTVEFVTGKLKGQTSILKLPLEGSNNSQPKAAKSTAAKSTGQAKPGPKPGPKPGSKPGPKKAAKKTAAKKKVKPAAASDDDIIDLDEEISELEEEL